MVERSREIKNQRWGPGTATLARSAASRASVDFAEREIDRSLVDRFESRVARFGRSVAVRDGQRQWSYEELNDTAVGRAILPCLDSKSQPVAMLCEAGAPAIAALLGILKAGMFYVPLDPSYPRARSEFMLADTGTRLLVTDARHALLAQQLAGDTQTILNVDELPVSSRAENLSRPVACDALAYVLYTSGSTGQPKGVMQNHRSVLFDIRRQTHDLAVTPDDRYGMLYSLSSSASVCHVFGALLNGASVSVYDIRTRGLDALARWLIDERITICDITVAAFRQFAATLRGDEVFGDLRVFAPGSEPVHRTDVELYRRIFDENCVLQNAYGTTETRTVAQYLTDKQTPLDEAHVPIGWPVADTDVLLLDDDGREVADETIGEIAVRSRYLSPGYWGQPDLTSRVFCPIRTAVTNAST
jgi:non-ribosomal peptide synthetase component F